MLRNLLLALAVALALIVGAGLVYLSQTRAEVTRPLRDGYRPRASLYSSAFTDTLWAHYERRAPEPLQPSVTLLEIIATAASRERHLPGLHMASTAAYALNASQGSNQAYAAGPASLLRELLLTQTVLERWDLDTMAAMYGERMTFRAGIVGLDKAAEQFFGKPAALLDAGEAATLLAMDRSFDRDATNACDVPHTLDYRDRIYAELQAVGLAPPGKLPQALVPAVVTLAATCYAK